MRAGADETIRRAWALIGLNQFDEALVLLRDIVRTRPTDPEVFLALGLCHLRLGRLERANSRLSQAIALAPDLDRAYVLRAEALQAGSQFEAAIADLDRFILRNPDVARPHYRKAECLRKLGDHPSAIACYGRAIALQPGYMEALCNRGVSYHQLQDFDRALACFDETIELWPTTKEAHLGRGLALRELGRLDEALESFDSVRRLDPTDRDGEGARARVLLLQGHFEQGLDLLTWARNLGDGAKLRRFEDFRAAINSGLLKGRHVVLRSDVGLGDTFHFCRYADVLSQLGAQVTLAVQSSLVRLVTSVNRQGPVAEVRSNVEKLPCDFEVDLAVVPVAVGTTLSSIPAHVPYLHADPQRVNAWAQRLGSDGIKVGVCWQGGLEGGDDLGRSFPVAHFAPLGAIPGVRLISLHKGAGLTQLDALPAGLRIESLGEGFDAGPDGFADCAAVIACCDLVISSDTSVAHLAGALGAPTWVALKHVPEWRWMLDRPDSPWYPTMRLFRQRVRGDWSGVFAEMAEPLAGLAAKR
jgi:tetratricopeptide (TPR) repeat protein